MTTALSAALHIPVRLGKAKFIIKPSEDTGLRDPALRICRVCTVKKSRYTCPKCNAPYCSSECYKTHGIKCTEEFFKQHVNDHLQLSETSIQDKRKVMEILKQNSTSEEPSHYLLDDAMISRFEKLACDDSACTLDSLTEEERRDFLHQTVSGKLSRFIQVWSPWWQMSEIEYRKQTENKRKGLVFIEELTEVENNSLLNDVPILEALSHPVSLPDKLFLSSLPRLNTLIGDRVISSKLLRHNMVDILFSYASVMRKFNGDWTSDALEAAEILLEASEVLKKNAKHLDVAVALHAVRCCLAKFDSVSTTCDSSNYSVGVSDIMYLLSSKLFTIDSLYDACELFKVAKKEYELNCNGFPRRKTSQAKKELMSLHQAERKLYFYICWLNDENIDFESTIQEIACVQQNLSND